MIQQFYSNTVYTKTDLLDKKTRFDLIEEIDDHLDNVNNYNQNGEYLEHALGLGNRKIKNSVCWFNLFRAIKKELKNYSEEVGDIKISNVGMGAFWANRIRYLTQKTYYERFYPNYLNVHDHKPSDFGMIYYLQNLSEIYGTIWYHEDKEIITLGKENSLVFCNTEMLHNPVHPPPEITIKYPRYVIVAEFKYRNKD